MFTTQAPHRAQGAEKTLVQSLPCSGRLAFFTLVFGFWMVALAQFAVAESEISRFVGLYSGEAVLTNAEGAPETRQMQVQIREGDSGFWVKWTTGRVRENGSVKSKTYEVDFRPSEREGIFAAAMRHNVFGHAVPLNPMKGEPYVWGRIVGDTLTVYSMFIDLNGDYDIQQYDRTLVDGGLLLDFTSHRNGQPLLTVQSLLKRH